MKVQINCDVFEVDMDEFSRVLWTENPVDWVRVTEWVETYGEYVGTTEDKPNDY